MEFSTLGTNTGSFTDVFIQYLAVAFAVINFVVILFNIFYVSNNIKKVKTETNSLITQLEHTDRAFTEQVNSIRRAEISKQIQEFLAPLKGLRVKSYKLYKIFAVEEKSLCREEERKLKEEFSRKGRNYSRSLLSQKQLNKCYFGTVRFFTSGYQFKESDLMIFDEILKVGDKIEALIFEKSYLPRNPALTEILGEYAAHIEATKLARHGKLDGVEESKYLSMPLELDGALESEIMKLENEYQSLLSEQASCTVRCPATESISYYDKHSNEYHNKTKNIDMTELYMKFRQRLTSQSQSFLLDAGCGSGRDTRYFIKSGFKVKSFDASAEMTRLCNMYPFAFCEQRTFSDVNELEMFHGVWACASLLHLDTEDFKDALFKLVSSLKPLGVLYFSIKASSKEESHASDGRRFYYHDPDNVKTFLSELGMEQFDIWTNEGKKEGNPSEFVNFICCKARPFTSQDGRARIS